MLTRTTYRAARERAVHYLESAGIVLRADEVERIEVADFGLSDLPRYGLQILTYVNTERCCAKELVMFPRQLCPEHRHPPVPALDYAGKEETFRCRSGRVFLYLPGPARPPLGAIVPASERERFTALSEIRMEPGDQVTILPDTLHWFQAGDEGAVITEFSTRSLDEHDVFTDARIARETQIAD
jgi:D-lyxose ketol-isomerase